MDRRRAVDLRRVDIHFLLDQFLDRRSITLLYGVCHIAPGSGSNGDDQHPQKSGTAGRARHTHVAFCSDALNQFG
jgi:hypothetical protein